MTDKPSKPLNYEEISWCENHQNKIMIRTDIFRTQNNNCLLCEILLLRSQINKDEQIRLIRDRLIERVRLKFNISSQEFTKIEEELFNKADEISSLKKEIERLEQYIAKDGRYKSLTAINMALTLQLKAEQEKNEKLINKIEELFSNCLKRADKTHLCLRCNGIKDLIQNARDKR